MMVFCIICSGGKKTQNAAVNHKFGSPVAKHKPRFIPKNKTIFLVGS